MSKKNFIGFSLILTLVYAVAIGLCIIVLDNLSSGNVGKLALATVGILFVIAILVVIVRQLDRINEN